MIIINSVRPLKLISITGFSDLMDSIIVVQQDFSGAVLLFPN